MPKLFHFPSVFIGLGTDLSTAVLYTTYLMRAVSTSSLSAIRCFFLCGDNVDCSIFSRFLISVDKLLCGIPYLAAMSFLAIVLRSTSSKICNLTSLLSTFLFNLVGVDIFLDRLRTLILNDESNDE